MCADLPCPQRRARAPLRSPYRASPPACMSFPLINYSVQERGDREKWIHVFNSTRICAKIFLRHSTVLRSAEEWAWWKLRCSDGARPPLSWQMFSSAVTSSVPSFLLCVYVHVCIVFPRHSHLPISPKSEEFRANSTNLIIQHKLLTVLVPNNSTQVLIFTSFIYKVIKFRQFHMYSFLE